LRRGLRRVRGPGRRLHEPHRLPCASGPQHRGRIEEQPMIRQRGTVLLMALMFLVVLSMLGLAMVSSTSVEERMARNARDQDVAMQAAEAALRDARIRVTGQYTSPAAPLSSWSFADDCSNGLCSPNATQPVWSAFNLD